MATEPAQKPFVWKAHILHGDLLSVKVKLLYPIEQMASSSRWEDHVKRAEKDTDTNPAFQRMFKVRR
jgi:hypothetical protein